MPKHLLFICSRNQWRSRTAEAIFRHSARYQVRSAGTAAAARHQVSIADLNWAEHILVMEEKHLEILRQRFPEAIRAKKVSVLHIPDEYRYLDPELIELLRSGVSQEVGPDETSSER